MRGFPWAASSLLPLVLLAGCDLAPTYHSPRTVLPADWKGDGIWKLATPSDAAIRGDWWTGFNNPVLDGLEARIGQNPDLAAAAERYEQARDLAAEAEAGLYPQIGGSFVPSADRQSAQRLFRSPDSLAPLQENNVQAAGTASWQIDLFGRIRNAARAYKQEAQATAADEADVRLSLQAALANAYVTLRGLDAETALYRQTVQFYQTGVSITSLRLSHKIGNLIDVERAQNELSGAEALATETAAQRALAENAIAVLIGVPASSFALPPQDKTPFVAVNIPTGVPASLLERRPDVSSAERQMAAANSEIGVARAAFFPNLTLNGDVGREASSFALFNGPLTLWSIGATLAEPIFEGGLRTAELRYAKSAYAETRDNYRATVLTAIQQAEDQIALTHLLAIEDAQSAQAEAAAEKAQSLSMSLYQQGLDNYLDVVVSEITALQASVSVLGIDIRAAQARVNLVLALGGGWTTADLPPEKKIVPFNPLLP